MTIPIKNKEGIAKMREACAIAATVLDQLKPLVRPGITTQDLEEAGRDWIARLGARSACYGYQHGSRRYPAHTCISVNDEVVHGIPSFRRVLRDGDIVSLDIVVWHDGYVGDNAFTVPVGTIQPGLEKLLRVSREALDLGIHQAQVGHRIGDISAAIQQHVEAHDVEPTPQTEPKRLCQATRKRRPIALIPCRNEPFDPRVTDRTRIPIGNAGHQRLHPVVAQRLGRRPSRQLVTPGQLIEIVG